MWSDTPEQALLRETVRKVVSREASLEQVGEWDRAGHYPEGFRATLAGIGLMGLPIPAEHHGGGAGPVEMVLVGEELSRSGTDLATDYGLCNFLGIVLATHGVPEVVDPLVAQMCKGLARFSIAMTEPDAGSDALAISTRAHVGAGSVVITGEKIFSTGAGLPGTMLLVACRTDGDSTTGSAGGMTLVLVPADAPGLEVRRLDTVGRKILGTYQLFFDRVEVPRENVVGQVGAGWQVLREGLQLERLYGCAVYLGSLETVLDLVRTYVTQRTQFGTTIGSFQAVSHRVVDIDTDARAARLLTYEAAHLLAAGRRAEVEVSRAKLFASEAAQRATNTAMQLMGGYGYMREFHVERFWREARIFTVTAGTSEVQRNMLARRLGITAHAPR